MARNLTGRVEVVTPVEGAEQQRRLREILDVYLDADTKGWNLQPDGSWRPIAGEADSQQRRYDLAQSRSRRADAA